MKCNHLVQWGWGGLRVVAEGRMKSRGDAEKRVTGAQGGSSEGKFEGRGDGGWEEMGKGQGGVKSDSYKAREKFTFMDHVA